MLLCAVKSSMDLLESAEQHNCTVSLLSGEGMILFIFSRFKILENLHRDIGGIYCEIPFKICFKWHEIINSMNDDSG